MSQHRPEKGVALYSDIETDLWERAEAKARTEIGESAREGEVLAKICAEYLGEEKPFREVTQ